MIPLRLIFRNRWVALAWSIGMIWTAVSFAGGDGQDLLNAAGGNSDANSQAIAALSQ